LRKNVESLSDNNKILVPEIRLNSSTINHNRNDSSESNKKITTFRSIKRSIFDKNFKKIKTKRENQTNYGKFNVHVTNKNPRNI